MSNLCPHCRAAVEPGDQFCGDCGRTIEPVAPDPPPRTKVRRSRGRFFGGVGLVAVLALAFTWYQGYLPDSIPSWDDLRQRRGSSPEGPETSDPEGSGRTEEAGALPGPRTQAVEGQEAGTPEDAPPLAIEGEDPFDDPPTEAEVLELPPDEYPPPEELVPPLPEDEAALITFPGEETDAPLPILFVINSEPEGARLFVDGDYRGTTPTLVEFDSVGVFQVRMTLAGHEDVVMEFDPREFGVGGGGAEDVVAITIPFGGSKSGMPGDPKLSLNRPPRLKL
ncbi:MAG: PEGA domain-containing protein [Gemmatimonadetes bacterium]|nr:PEGA domain-containing protein [Gemmatimonadota bacterium]NNM06393.1 PEGA domain-containing protein [Gemmatimonadota bacterium]